MKVTQILLFFLFIPVLCSSAQLYKWKDSEGQLHITDTPPPQNASEVTVTRYKKHTQTPAQQQFQYVQNYYDEQQRRKDYRFTQQQLTIREHNKNIEKINDHLYDTEKARLEALIERWNRAIDIRDPKSRRDYCRDRRDYYKNKLRILKRYH